MQKVRNGLANILIVESRLVRRGLLVDECLSEFAQFGIEAFALAYKSSFGEGAWTGTDGGGWLAG